MLKPAWRVDTHCVHCNGYRKQYFEYRAADGEVVMTGCWEFIGG